MLHTAPALAQPLGVFDGHTDVGSPALAGAASYDAEAQTYRLTGAGRDVWYDHDEFHYAWKRIEGDFILRAHARLLGEGAEAHRKTGWMVRASLEPDAAHVSAVVHGDGLTALQFRRQKGGPTEELRAPITGADVIQLARHGSTFAMSVAAKFRS